MKRIRPLKFKISTSHTGYGKIKRKKSLGQNFLKSISALDKIITNGEINSKDLILEIGPGKGILTQKLIEKASQVIAVEKDPELVQFLTEKFALEIAQKKLILIEQDILKFDLNDAKYRFFPSCYKIIANIPYNITGAILKKFLTEKIQPERMILMVQQEVAQRIVATNKKENLLSISVKAYGEPKIITKVPARYFSPKPKVDSAILAIKNISKKFFKENKITEENFWEILHAGFAHKRKKLSSNLKKYTKNISPKKLLALENKRAENLSLQDWILLIKN